MTTTGEVVVRMRGGGMATVIDLIRSGQLKFTVSPSRHHGGNILQVVLRKLVANPALRDAMAFATAKGCAMEFRHGHKIHVDVEKGTIFIGIDCDPDEAVQLLAGHEF